MIKRVFTIVSLCLCLMFLVACGAGQATPTDSGAGAKQAQFTDPFAYCAAVGTIDAPDERYTGPELPEAVAKGLLELGLVTADTPPEIVKNAAWRCMDGKVLVCHFGANIPCMEKADASRTPTSEMGDFCKSNPSADVIPAAVTGRATVYEWSCKDGAPAIVKELFKPDAQGFLSDFWHEIKQ
jgi:hypothetical protein